MADGVNQKKACCYLNEDRFIHTVVGTVDMRDALLFLSPLLTGTVQYTKFLLSWSVRWKVPIHKVNRMNWRNLAYISQSSRLSYHWHFVDGIPITTTRNKLSTKNEKSHTSSREEKMCLFVLYANQESSTGKKRRQFKNPFLKNASRENAGRTSPATRLFKLMMIQYIYLIVFISPIQ